MRIYNLFSPNFDHKKRTKKDIKAIVIHYTGMQSERESLNRLCNLKSKVSSHFFIGKNGKVYNLVKENKTAWHAGKSCWSNFKNLNKNSIGIELANKGHEFGYTNFKKKQILSLIMVIKMIIKKYKIEKKNVVAHSDIAPLRKMDPGEKFPWQLLAKKNIGIWYNVKKNLIRNYRKVKISTPSAKHSANMANCFILLINTHFRTCLFPPKKNVIRGYPCIYVITPYPPSLVSDNLGSGSRICIFLFPC